MRGFLTAVMALGLAGGLGCGGCHDEPAGGLDAGLPDLQAGRDSRPPDQATDALPHDAATDAVSGCGGSRIRTR